MQIIKQVIGKQIQFGGKEHDGWLPPNAAHPETTTVRKAIVDVQIVNDGAGFLLICESRNTADSWDTWHESIEDAEEQAKLWLGIEHLDWEKV